MIIWALSLAGALMLCALALYVAWLWWKIRDHQDEKFAREVERFWQDVEGERK